MNGPIVILDTSAINWLADDQDYAVLKDRIVESFFVRIIEPVVTEMVSTASKDRRAILLTVQRRLSAKGDTVIPHQKILKDGVRFFEKGRLRFDWHDVQITSKEIQDFLASNEIDDALSQEQSTQNKDIKKRYTEVFEELSALCDANITKKPASLEEMLDDFENGPLLTAIGKMLYPKDDGVDADDETLRTFYDVYPPFRALLVAVLISQWDRCFATWSQKQRKKLANLIDIRMATYLPYCQIFVTSDDDQLRVLKDVVPLAKLSRCTVMHYDEFKAHLTKSKVAQSPED